MPKSLTDPLIRSIQPPERGQITVIDGSLKNFGIRVSQGGSKSWVVVLGKGRRQTLGTYPTLSLADARAEAKRILAEKTLGRIKPQRAAFEDCVREYLKECEHRLKPGTLKLYTYHLTRDFPFGRQAIADTTPRQIITQLNRCTPSMKEHAARIGRTFFLWAVRNHFLDASPMARIALPAKGKSRDRVLTDPELSAVYGAARRLSGPYAGIVQLAVLTGQRRGELAAIEWSWIDREAMTLSFPTRITKNKRQHTIPLSDTSLSVLDRQLKLSDKYTFPAARERRAGQPATIFNSWSKNKVAFDKKCPIAPWTLHDLRRTFSSGMAALSVPQVVVEKLLNHVSGGTQSPISQVYNRHSYMAEMREALTKWETFLATLGPPTS